MGLRVPEDRENRGRNSPNTASPPLCLDKRRGNTKRGYKSMAWRCTLRIKLGGKLAEAANLATWPDSHADSSMQGVMFEQKLLSRGVIVASCASQKSATLSNTLDEFLEQIDLAVKVAEGTLRQVKRL
ncbi:MAG: hypothetical protein M1357_01120 [Candidatus Marsarchaeota archaeon]|nr:hypothetical protein [Candidatus Marsarchaeota archaeon]